jgi:hypothetical protein
MSRLTFDPNATLRAMQISEIELWILVEDTLDASFYRNLFRAPPAPPRSFRIKPSRELSGSGGKSGLIAFHNQLCTRGVLISRLQGAVKVTSILFFLDRDIDHLCRRQVDSAHVVYTEHYNLENYLFRDGDVVRALSTATDLDEDEIASRIDCAWLGKAAEAWFEWVAFCYFVHSRRIGVEGYARPSSPFNESPYEPSDTDKIQEMVDDALTKHSKAMRLDVLRRNYKNARKFVRKLYLKADHDQVFNGKWYCRFIQEDYDRIRAGRQYHGRDLAESVKRQLLAALDYSAGWTNRYRTAVEQACLSIQRCTGHDKT